MTLFSRRAVLAAGTAGLALPWIGKALAAPGLKLGCLTDLNGPYAAISGKGVLAAMKLAVEDFSLLHPGIPVETVVADFGLKADNGLAILNAWLDNDGVDAVTDFPLSPLALAAGKVLEDKNKVGLVTSAASSELTRGGCGPNHIQFSTDTFAFAASLVKSIIAQGGETWFFILPNYEFGKSMVADATRAVTEAGAKVLGQVAYPFPGTTDFSSALLQAQASGAKVICFANAGDDLTNCLKQAREFHITGLVAAPFMAEPTINALGLEASQGTYFSGPYYWGTNAGSRQFADRHMALLPGQRPSKNFANAYSGTLHYLKIAAVMGVEAAKKDGRAVVAAMKATAMQDSVYGSSVIRVDGYCLRDMLLLKVKAPSESREPWDFCHVVSTMPGAAVARPVAEGGCKLVRA
jgi:branched-chain amino acid transport system substrate-binding protein